MTNRVLLTPNAFKVSREGWDVVTAPKGGLLFDSDYTHGKIYANGIFVFPTISDPGGSGSAGISGNVFFGKTFPTPPICYLRFYGEVLQNWNGGARWNYNYVEGREWWTSTWADVRTDRIHFGADAEWWEDLWMGMTVNYMVLDHE